MKKNFVVLLVVIFMVSCLGLVGCSKEKTATTPSAQQEQKAGDTAKSDAGNELANLMKSARQVQGMSYEMINTITTQGQTQTSKSSVWMSKEKMRMESEMSGMQSIIINDAKGDVWFYNPATKTAMKMTNVKDQDKMANKWAEDDSYISKMKIVGQESLDGYKCVVVTVKDAETDTKMWLRKDIGMPVKMESKMAGSTVVIEYKNFKLGAQDDSLFEVPAGASIIEMPSAANLPAVPNVPGQ